VGYIPFQVPGTDAPVFPTAVQLGTNPDCGVYVILFPEEFPRHPDTCWESGIKDLRDPSIEKTYLL